MTTLYTLEQVAEMTGFALRTLQRDARAGRITHIHRGRSRLMTPEHVEELLATATKKPPSDLAADDGMARVRAVISRSRR